MPLLIGTAPNQVPTNGDLGTMAFEDAINYNEKTLPNVIEVNSSSTALRVTQTGSGNALVVEDSANPDSTPTVIDSAGRVIVGSTGSFGGYQIQSQTTDGANFNAMRFSNDGGGTNIRFDKSRSTTIGGNAIVAGTDNLGSLVFRGDDGVTFIQAATITASVDGTPGTNDMPGRLVFSTTADGASSPTERMRIDNAGRVGIGSTSLTGYRLKVGGGITGQTNSYGIASDQAVLSDVTASGNYFVSTASTQAASFTLSTLRHYWTYQNAFGAGSTVSNQYGFYADNSLTGATNNYGFYSNIASGTGRYNFYAAGSADNYFAGKIYTASTLTSAGTIYQSAGSNQGAINISCTNSNVTGASTLYLLSGANNTNYGIVGSDIGTIWFSNTAYQGGAKISGEAAENQAAGAGGCSLIFKTTPTGTTTSTERMRIDSSGNLIQSAPTTAPTLSTNGTMVFNLTSNTNLRVSVRGSDGVTRTANITLA